MEMMAYKFENRIHHVCMTCHNTDAAHAYNQEIQTINQNHLISLEQDRDDLQQRVAVLERKESILRGSIRVIQAEIAACKDIETGYTTQIAALFNTVVDGEVARTLVQDQDH
jgi:hypothetical protein